MYMDVYAWNLKQNKFYSTFNKCDTILLRKEPVEEVVQTCHRNNTNIKYL